MKILVAGAIAALAVAGLPAAADATTPAADTAVPTITKIALAVQDASISGSSPCVSIPIAVSYVTNGDYVYQIDVYVTHGTLPSDTTSTATQLMAPGTTDNGTVTGTLTYCPTTQGIGNLDAGPSVIHYAAPTDVGQSTVTAPATAQFDVQQASTAYLKIHRHHKLVTLEAAETYYNYTNGAIKGTATQRAVFQVLGKHNKWLTFAKAKPGAKGLATVTVNSKKQRNYRVAFEPSATIALAVSDVVTK